MMKQLDRYILDFESSLKYVRDTLDEANTFSKSLLNELDFSRGIFFTFLPAGSNLERIYKYNEGLVLPQHEKVEYTLAGKQATSLPIPNIKDELALLIRNYLLKYTNTCCVFDDVIRTSKSKPSKMGVQPNCVYFYDDELYYLVSNSTAKTELILKCLQNSNGFWHSAGAITEIDPRTINGQNFDSKIFELMCAHVKLLFVGAYDSESYVFWEASDFQGFQI